MAVAERGRHRFMGTALALAREKRALISTIAEITKKMDVSIAIESLARSKHRRVTSVTLSIEAEAVPNSDLKRKKMNRVSGATQGELR
jgi:hypothetical protein